MSAEARFVWLAHDARRLVALLALVAAGSISLLTAAVGAAARQDSGTLTLHADLRGPVTEAVCPAGTPANMVCDLSTGGGTVRGLGTVSTNYLNLHGPPGTSCEFWHSNPVLAVAGKGSIDLAVTTPSGSCVNGTFSTVDAALVFTVTGGSGIYADASGGGTFVTRGSIRAVNTDTLDGTITVPGLAFDLTPPVISGAHAKTALAPKHATFARVRYTVTAHDDTDGTVPVVCTPASGSRFKIGRTTVHCAATDSSDNPTTANFVITVKRH